MSRKDDLIRKEIEELLGGCTEEDVKWFKVGMKESKKDIEKIKKKN